NKDWVRTMTPRDVLASEKPAGRVYLPTASYAEMLHWALPTVKSYTEYEEFEHLLKDDGVFDKYNQFVRGGFWRNFLVKYPEINAMHKKMLRVSERVDRLNEEIERGVRSGVPQEQIASARASLEKAFDHLMAGQCNCPYWHGVFGGIYLFNIRTAIYRELIEAEKELDKLERVSAPYIEAVDYNLDG